MHKSFVFRRQFPLFCFCSFLGLLLGFAFALRADASLLSWMRLAVKSRVSIFVSLSCALPFLIAAHAVLIEQWNLLHLLGFLRFFCWGLCAGICVGTFGSAAWLVQPMLQFSDSVSLLLLCLCCARWCDADKLTPKRDLCIALSVTLFAVVMDYFIVSPYLATLF